MYGLTIEEYLLLDWSMEHEKIYMEEIMIEIYC